MLIPVDYVDDSRSSLEGGTKLIRAYGIFLGSKVKIEKRPALE